METFHPAFCFLTAISTRSYLVSRANRGSLLNKSLCLYKTDVFFDVSRAAVLCIWTRLDVFTCRLGVFVINVSRVKPSERTQNVILNSSQCFLGCFGMGRKIVVKNEDFAKYFSPASESCRGVAPSTGERKVFPVSINLCYLVHFMSGS